MEIRNIGKNMVIIKTEGMVSKFLFVKIDTAKETLIDAQKRIYALERLGWECALDYDAEIIACVPALTIKKVG